MTAAIAGVATAFPPHYYPQEQLTAAAATAMQLSPRQAERLRELHANTGIRGRHLVLPLERYREPADFTATNAAWLAAALELGERACRAALAASSIAADQVDAIVFTTVTGLASPSVDARLLQRLGLRPDVKRLPLFGLGCVAGAAAIARAADLVAGTPHGVVLVLAVEICSLTLQCADHSVANLISVGLFGDGAAAAVITGSARSEPGPRIVATRSVFYPDTEHIMGWQIGAHGFRIVLSAEVPTIARERLPADVDAFLAVLGLARADIRRWIAHPGGPKVLEALQHGLGLPRAELQASWDSLARVGNLSSASVLMILGAVLGQRPGAPGELGMLLAMGPGFCSELLLLRW
jgi:alkylresorcinol/alkylpyrone synthase